MKAMLIENYGENAPFTLTEIPKPSVKPGHVLIKIAASSVNTVDTMIRNMGKELPLSPDTPALLGMDFAGTVEEVGADVSGLKVGDEVYGCAGGLADLPGTLTEYIVADAQLVALKPRNLSMRQAAALPLVAITAYEGLMRCQIEEGDRVLVHGGGGGVGHVAVQLAIALGAEVYATGSERHLEIIEGFGATAINYKTESVADYVTKYTDGQGFDIVFDSVGGANMLNSFEAAMLNGQVASTVSLCEIDLSQVHFKGLSLHVIFMLIPMLHNTDRQLHHDILEAVAEIAEAGVLTPLINENKYTLEQAGEAYAQLQSGKALGKVVIEN